MRSLFLCVDVYACVCICVCVLMIPCSKMHLCACVWGGQRMFMFMFLTCSFSNSKKAMIKIPSVLDWKQHLSLLLKLGQTVSGRCGIFSKACERIPFRDLRHRVHRDSPLCSSAKIYGCLCLAWYLNKTNPKYTTYAIKTGWTNHTTL